MGFVKEVLMDWLDAYAFHNAGIHSQDKNYAREVFPDEKLNIQAKTNIPEGDTVQTQIVIHTNTSTTPIVVDEEEYVENTEVNRTLTIEEIAKGQGLKLESILAISANFEHDGKKQQTNKVKIAPLISEAYFAVEEDGKEQAYPDMAELKTIYIANGGKDGSKDTRDANGTVKGEVTFHYAVAGDTFKGVSDKYKIEGDVNKGKSKLFDLSKTRDLPKEKQFIIANTPELYFYVKQPKRPKVYKQIDKVSLSQEVFLVIKSKQKLGSKVKVEIVEDGTYINTTKDTPVGFQEITGTADKPIKTEKKLYEVELTKVDDKGLNEGAIKIELAPKSEITLKGISDKFKADEPDKVPEVKINTTAIEANKAYTRTGATEKDYKYVVNEAYCKENKLGYSIGSVGTASKLVNLNISELGKMNNLRTTKEGLYWPHVGEPIFYHESNLNANYKKEVVNREADMRLAKSKMKPKTTNLFIRGKDGENIVKSKCTFGKESEIYRNKYIVNHIPINSTHRPAKPMSPEYLTIHSTGNPKSTATGERNYLTNALNTSSTGYHIVVDANQAIECIPFSENAYHAADGEKGTGNRKSIGLEIIESGDRKKTLDNAIRLAAQIMVDNNLGIDKLKRHYDWSGKNCPRILLKPTENSGESSQTWNWFKNKVEELI